MGRRKENTVLVRVPFSPFFRIEKLEKRRR
jgi:hypothetical protein